MAGPANTPSARGASTPRRQFEQRYHDALGAHFADPTPRGLAEAQELGREALSEGISILDVVSIHMEARRGLFPDVGSKFADIDAFLRGSLLPSSTSRTSCTTPNASSTPRGDGSPRLRRMRDVAAALSRATTRRAVAAVILRATMEVTGGQVGTVALFRGRHAAAIVGPICWRRCRRATLAGCVR